MVSMSRIAWGKPGSKVARKTTARVFSAGAKAVIVIVYPDGIIGLRLERGRKEEYVEAATLYRQAVVARVRAEKLAKRKKR